MVNVDVTCNAASVQDAGPFRVSGCSVQMSGNFLTSSVGGGTCLPGEPAVTTQDDGPTGVGVAARLPEDVFG
jgi:hypothetical protein